MRGDEIDECMSRAENEQYVREKKKAAEIETQMEKKR